MTATIVVPSPKLLVPPSLNIPIDQGLHEHSANVIDLQADTSSSGQAVLDLGSWVEGVRVVLLEPDGFRQDQVIYTLCVARPNRSRSPKSNRHIL